MPNWVYNNVSVIGKKKRVEEFRKKHFTKDEIRGVEFDFETLVPMPETVFRGNLGTQEREKYGNNNWYDWSVKHWGTKWNASNTQFHSDDVRKTGRSYSLEFMFETAWALPEPIYTKIAEMYPDLSIVVDYSEEGMGFAGELQIVEGKINHYAKDPMEGIEEEE
jgi:hypothetical protein